MSAFKTILVPVAAGAGATSSMEAAILVGRLFGSHITALHVRLAPASAIPLADDGMSGAMIEEMIEAAEHEAALRADEAKAAFEQVRVRHEIADDTTPPSPQSPPILSMVWREESGREDEVVALLGRTSDLIVMTRPRPGRDTTGEMTVNSALLESGRPVLLTPARVPKAIGHRIVIAWNGSIEAARAVSAAMPLLARAEAVSIVVASSGHPLCGAEELAAQLSWRGITSDVRQVSLGGSAFGPALLEEAAARYADLIVMGAYTHSRLRQLLLGGVTRHVLEHSNLPVLLSH